MNLLLRYILWSATLVLAMLSLQGCIDTKAQPDEWLVKVGDSYITDDVFDLRVQRLPEQYRAQLDSDAAKKGILDQLVNEELLYMEAKASKLDQSENYKSVLEKAEEQFNQLKRQTLINELLAEKLADKVSINDQAVKNYFDQNQNQFAEFEKRRASHILVKTESEANKVKAKLNKGASFEALAASESLDPTGKNGGDLGWFAKGQLAKNFEDAVYALRKEGEISSVVQTQFGFHVIKLDGVELVPARTFEQVKTQIKQLLSAQLQRQELEKFVDELKAKYIVEFKAEKVAEDVQVEKS